MTCNKYIGEITIRLDNTDRISDFRYNKFSCIDPAGGVSVLPYIKGRTVKELLDNKPTKYLSKTIRQAGGINLMLENQYAAAVLALSVYLGKETNEAGSPFTVKAIEYDREFTEIKGYVTLDSPDEISGCGRCRGNSGQHHRAE